MPPQALTLSTEPHTHQVVRQQLAAPARVTGKVRAAIEAMVWLALPRKQAAEHAGISEHGLYKALRKPPVRAHYLSELEVLRTSERARNIHRLTEIRDAANNMPAVNAIKALEQIDEQQQAHGTRAPAVPGFVIVVQGPGAPMPHMREIEAKPLNDKALGHIERVGAAVDYAQEDP